MQELVNAPAVLQLCPSFGKECGIFRYSLYVRDALSRSGIESHIYGSCRELDHAVRSASQPPIILVQHEYGLLDFASPTLSGPDTTANVLSWLKIQQSAKTIRNAAWIMHTLVTKDKSYELINKQIFSAGVRVLHLCSRGSLDNGLEYIDHGVPVLSGSELEKHIALKGIDTVRPLQGKVLAAFGMLSANKTPAQILDVCKVSGWRLIGSFASTNRSEQAKLESRAEILGVECTLYFDFADEETLLRRFAGVDACIALQERNRHSATSGSIRFLFSMGVPVLCNDCQQFDDVREGTLVVNPETAARILKDLAESPELYEKERRRAIRYASNNTISQVYQALYAQLNAESRTQVIGDSTSTVGSANGRRLSRLSPFSRWSVDKGQSRRETLHLDVCLVCCLSNSERREYLRSELKLTDYETKQIDRELTLKSLNIIELAQIVLAAAEWKAATVTWGMAEDIEMVCARIARPEELACSGSFAYMAYQCTTTTEGLYPDRIHAWIEHAKNEPTWLVNQLLKRCQMNQQITKGSMSRLQMIHARAMQTSTKLRQTFKPLSPHGFYYKRDHSLLSTCQRLDELENMLRES